MIEQSMRFAGIVTLSLVVALAACKGKGKSEDTGYDNNSKDYADLPADVRGWVVKLDSKTEVGKALTELEKLKNPAAIAPLIAGWKKRSADGQFLRAIITIARNRTTGDVHAAALPFLTQLATSARVTKPPTKTVDQAVHALRAIKGVKTPTVHKAFIDVCTHEAKFAYATRATVIACLALADRPGDKSYKALVTALDYGSKAKSARVAAAAARGLGKLGDKRALEPLARTMYLSSKAFPSVREALVAMGPTVVPKMMAIFGGVDSQINELAKKAKMPRPAMMRQAALMLGDVYYAKAVPHLIKSLEQPGIHHEAVFIALTQIADPTAAKAVLAYARDAKRKKQDRVNAIGAYGVLAPGAKQLPTLLAWLSREKDPVLRNILSLSCAQLVRDAGGLARLLRALPAKKKVSKAAAAVASVGALCGKDSGCYLIQVESLPKQLHERISKLKGISLTAKQVAQIKPFIDVRALTDVVKLRRKQAVPLTTLLRLLATARIAVHQQLLYALVHTSPRPCPKCVAGLEALLKRKGRVPAQITQGLRMIRNYLSWAK